MKHAEFLNKVYEYVEAGKSEIEAVDLVYDTIDDLLLECKFNEVDEILEEVNTDKLDTNTIVGFLSISRAAVFKLHNLYSFIVRAEYALLRITENPSRVKNLMRDLQMDGLKACPICGCPDWLNAPKLDGLSRHVCAPKWHIWSEEDAEEDAHTVWAVNLNEAINAWGRWKCRDDRDAIGLASVNIFIRPDGKNTNEDVVRRIVSAKWYWMFDILEPG